MPREKTQTAAPTASRILSFEEAGMNYKIKEMPCIYGGKKIFGLLYMPECGGTAPVVIMSHGYNSLHTALLDFAEGLAQNGVYAYRCDLCGGSS